MNINGLDSFIQQTFNRAKENTNQRSQSDIAASIGNAKSQQAQKAQLAQQIQQTLQRRQNSNFPVTTQSVTPEKDSNSTFSIYV